VKQHGTVIDLNAPTEAQRKLLRYDPDLLGLGDGHEVLVVSIPLNVFEDQSNSGEFLNKHLVSSVDFDMSGCITGPASTTITSNLQQVRRLAALGSATAHPSEDSWDGTEDTLYLCLVGQDADVPAGSDNDNKVVASEAKINWPLADQFANSTVAKGALVGTKAWGLEDEKEIPEINIKVDSIAVSAVTKKLKARWTPELGQDLNAYHNLDAEVELTSILSEQIALEIDQEILNDLIQGAKAGTQYWSRSPGLFVDRETGAELGASSAAPDFTGTVSEWYETLVEAINDVSAKIHRKTLRGGANFCVTSPEVANILEFTSGFRANITADENKGTIGAVNVGSISKKFDLYVDPYFPRNLILVGRKGSSFLESGYVYAPYVPLQVTPTIFGEDDFTPRKGVMTRYAKQMVKPDMYGLVVVRGITGEAGATS